MIVYGRNAVFEALRGPRPVAQVWASRRVARLDWLRGVAVTACEEHELQRRTSSDDHQGICAEVGEFRYADPDKLLEPADALVVCCDQIQDPQNLGSICRIAECAGASGVVICERRACQITAAVCKASAGAVEHIAVARVKNLGDYLLGAKSAQCWIYGASERAPHSYTEPDYTDRVVVVLGSEGRGLRRRVRELCDELIAVPMAGRVGSLNVSTVAAVILYEILQSRVST